MSGGRDLCMKSLIALFAEDHAENECMVRLNEYNFYQPSGQNIVYWNQRTVKVFYTFIAIFTFSPLSQ